MIKSKFIVLVISAVVFLFPISLAAQIKNQPYCSIFSRTEIFDGKKIKTRALMTHSTVSRVDGGDTFLYSPDCNNGDYFAVVDFNGWKNLSEWEKFFSELPSQRNYIFDVSFTGELETNITPLYGHLSWSLSQIKFTEISSIKDVTADSQIKEPDYEADEPLTSKGSLLQSISRDFVLHLFNNNFGFGAFVDKYLSDDFSLTDVKGNKYEKKSYQKIIIKDLFTEIEEPYILESSISDIVLKKGYYEVFGKLMHESREGKKQTVKYKHILQFANDSWLLKGTHFTKP